MSHCSRSFSNPHTKPVLLLGIIISSFFKKNTTLEFSVNVICFNKWRFLVGVLLLESSINFNIRRNTWRHRCKCHHDGKTLWLNLLSCLKAKEPHSSNRCSQTETVTVYDIQSLLLINLSQSKLSEPYLEYTKQNKTAPSS